MNPQDILANRNPVFALSIGYVFIYKLAEYEFQPIEIAISWFLLAANCDFSQYILDLFIVLDVYFSFRPIDFNNLAILLAVNFYINKSTLINGQ